MAGEYLPPVVTRLTGDISDLMAKIAEAKAAMKGLGSEINISIDPSSFDNLVDAIDRVGAAVDGVGSAIDDHGGIFPALADGAQAAAAGFRLFGTGIRISGNALHWLVAGSFEFLAVAVPALIALIAGALVAYQGAVENVGRHLQALYTTTEATAGAFGKTAGDILGIGHALQAAQNAANPGVYEVLGSVLNGVKTRFVDLAGAGLQTVHAFDEFAARVNIDLAGSMGSTLHDLLGNMVGDLTGLSQILGNVGHGLLNLAGAMPGLVNFLLKIAVGLSQMFLWLTSVHPLLFTIAMGLEEFWRWGGLAATAVGLISRAIVGLPTAAFRLFLNAVGSAGRIMSSLFTAGGTIAAGLGRIGQVMQSLIGVGGRFSQAMFGVGTALQRIAGDTALMQGLGVGLGIFVTLAILLGHVKDQAEQMASNVTKAVDAAQGLQIFAVAAEGLDKLNMATIQATDRFNTFSPAVRTAGDVVAGFEDQRISPALVGISRFTTFLGGAGRALANFGRGQVGGGILVSIGNFMAKLGGASQAAQDIGELNQAEAQVMARTAIFAGNLSFLAGKFHTTAVGAAYLAEAAGVNLQVPLTKGSEGAKIAAQQISNLERGIGAMGAPMGVLGNDMTALGVASQLTGTKVAQLNQAWDQWIQNVTATPNDMAEIQNALNGMDHAALNTSSTVSGAIGSISTAAKGTSYTLKGMGNAAMQSWQQFAGAIQTGNSALDQLRIGMAEGVVSGGHFESTVKGLVGEMLPFTQGNRTAVKMLSQLAHEAGGPTTSNLRTLAKWAGITGRAARDQFVKGMLAATNAMGNMSKVAQNLSAVINNQIDQALAGAIIQYSGLNGAITKYVKDVANSHTPQSTLQSDLGKIAAALNKENGMMSTVSKGWNAAQGQARGLTGDVNGLRRALNSLHNKTVEVQINQVYTTEGIPLSAGKLGAITGGYASGTSDASPGWHWVGESGPELMYFRGGEQVKSHSSSVSAAADGGGTEVRELQPIIVNLDGKPIYQAVEQRVYRKNMQNGMRTRTGNAQGRFGVR